jgi:hypothetical protein
LAEALAKEPVEERDRFFAAMLRPLGIEKGKPFQPDDRQKKILTEAASVGEAMAKALTFDKLSKGIRYRPDAQWDYVLAPDITTNENDSDEILTQVLMALPENRVGKPSSRLRSSPNKSAVLALRAGKSAAGFNRLPKPRAGLR